MIINFIENIFHSLKKVSLVDPATFNDPLALDIEWTPIAAGGSNFRTHKAVMVSTSRIEFRPTIAYLLFPLIGLLVPILMIILLGASHQLDLFLAPQSIRDLSIIGTFFLFVALSLIFIWRVKRAIVFDRAANAFWRGKRRSQVVPGPGEIPNSVPLPDIHALQIIPEKVAGSGKNSSPYTSYELNLVRRNGERVNVIDHGNKKKMLVDAQMIAQFLNVPIWDAGPVEKNSLQQVLN